MTTRTLFISDLHLDPGRPATVRALADFLQTNTDCAQLYILGDLFEAWIGDDDDSPLALEVSRLLAAFSRAGPELFLMQGNRDFLLGESFCKLVGGQLIPDPIVIDLQGEPTLLMHGDSLCTADTGYQAFRKTARDPKWQAELLAHSLDERRAFAAELRSRSMEAKSNKAEDIMDVSGDAVAHIMRQHSVKQMIHGHTHRPDRHDTAIGTRWVLGDWDRQGWFLEASEGDITLNSFDIFQ